MAHTNWIDNDELFFRHLEEARKWELYVAVQLLQEGVAVEWPPQEIRRDKDDIKRFADQTDLYAGRDPIRKIEVKAVSREFTGRYDLPYNNTIVTTLRSWNDALNKPYAFVIVSKPTGAMVVVPRHTSDNWTTKMLKDNTRKITDQFLIADKQDVRTWDDFIHALKLNERKYQRGA